MVKPSATSAVVQVVVAGLVGTFALPAVAGGATPTGGGPSVAAVAWLAGGLLVSAWLLVMGPGLVAGLAHLLDQLIASDGSTVARQTAVRAGTGVAARWIVAVVEVVLIQAVLRRPVVAVAGTLADPSTVDAVFAAGTLILLIVILIWLHRSARPLVEAATWQALDALIATSGSERAQAAAEAADTQLATVPAATERPVSVASEVTRRAGSAEQTVAAIDDGATRLAPGVATVTIRGEEATRPAAEHDDSADLTRPN